MRTCPADSQQPSYFSAAIAEQAGHLFSLCQALLLYELYTFCKLVHTFFNVHFFMGVDPRTERGYQYP